MLRFVVFPQQYVVTSKLQMGNTFWREELKIIRVTYIYISMLTFSFIYVIFSFCMYFSFMTFLKPKVENIRKVSNFLKNKLLKLLHGN